MQWQGGKARNIVWIAEDTRLMSTHQGFLQACIREIGCAGDTNQTLLIPDPNSDGTALSRLQLLGFSAINLHRGTAAAAGSEIPLCDSFASSE